MAFAELYPIGSRAKQELKVQIEWFAKPENDYTRRFLQERISKSSDTDSAHDEAPSKHAFALSFSILPQDLKQQCWWIGKGPSGCDSLEIVLAPSEVTKVYAALKFHPRSGYLMLEAPGTSQIKFKRDSGRWHSEQKFCLSLVENAIRFSNLEYCLKYTIQNVEQYKDNREEFLNNSDTVILNRKFDSFPKSTHSRFRDYMVHGTIAQGAFGWVVAGVHKTTGEPVAIKELRMEHGRDRNDIVREAEICLEFKQSVNGILQTIETICEHGQELPCGIVPEKFFLVTCLAICDFKSVPWSNVEYSDRLALFNGTLEGLCFLHKSGYIHRDITTSNLLVLSVRPRQAVIADFGKMIRSKSSREKCIGPPRTLAPEVWSDEEYTNAIDVWSLAYAWLETFTDEISHTKIDPTVHAQLLAKIDRIVPYVCHGLVYLLRRMLTWDVETRITAEEAWKYWFERH